MSPGPEVITLVSLTPDHLDTMYQLSLGLAARPLQCSRGRLFRVTDARARGREAGPEAEEDGYRGWAGPASLCCIATLSLAGSQPLSSGHSELQQANIISVIKVEKQHFRALSTMK